MHTDHNDDRECKNCSDWYKSKGLKIKAPFTLSSSDLPVKGKMNEEDHLNYVIDANTLSADEFIRKYC